MKHLFNWKKTLAALCVLALLVSILSGAALAEEMVEIPESDYLYVNGESKVLSVDGELSGLLRLIVEDSGMVHILSSGVDITLVLFDEGAEEVRGVYSSQNGLMDVPFDAAPGSYLLGVSGSGEIEVLVADDAQTEAIYSTETVVPAAEAAEADAPAEEAAEASAEVPAAEAEAEEPAAAPAAPSYDPSVPIRYRAALNETVSVLDILHAAGANVEAVTYVSGNVEGRMVSSASNVTLGDWLLTAYVPFDSIELSVRTFEDVTYTLIFSCPAPEAESVEAPEEVATEEPAEAPAAEAIEAPADETPAEEPVGAPAEEAAEQSVDTPAEVSAEEAAEDPAEDAAVEEPAEASAEQPEKKQGFLTGFVNWLVGTPASSETSDEEAEQEAETVEATEAPADEAAEDSAEAPADEAAEDSAEAPADEAAEDSAEAPADEAAEDSAEAPVEEAVEDSAEVSVEEAPVFDPTAPISRQVTNNETLSLLTVLAEAEVPANVITNVSGELEGRVILNQNNGDWLITPYAYFNDLTLIITASDYLAEDPAATEADYTVVLSNPDPDAPDEEETTEPVEGAEGEAPAADAADDPAADAAVAAPSREVSIAAERGEDNAIRLFAENISEEEKDTFTYQWQYSLDNEEWLDVEGANDKDYNFQLDETNGLYYWRLIVSYK